MAYFMMFHLYYPSSSRYIGAKYLFYLRRVPRCIGIQKFNVSEHTRTVINIYTVSCIDTSYTNICPLVTILWQNTQEQQNVTHSLPYLIEIFIATYVRTSHLYILVYSIYSAVQQWRRRRSHLGPVQSVRSLGSCSHTETN